MTTATSLMCRKNGGKEAMGTVQGKCAGKEIGWVLKPKLLSLVRQTGTPSGELSIAGRWTGVQRYQPHPVSSTDKA